MVYLGEPNWQRKEAPARSAIAGSVLLDEEWIWREVRRAARFLTFNAGEDRGSSRIYRFTAGTSQWRACAVPLRDAPAASGVVVVVIQREEPRLPSARELQRRFGLTAREAEVALLLAERKSNKEIAQELSVTQFTARRHTERILQKLGINSRTEVRRRVLGIQREAGSERPLPMRSRDVVLRNPDSLRVRTTA